MPSKYKKRKDGRYASSVIVGADADGKPERKAVYAKTIRELEFKLSELRRQVSTGTVVKNENLTLQCWAYEWLSTYKAGVTRRTYTMYESSINAKSAINAIIASKVFIISTSF